MNRICKLGGLPIASCLISYVLLAPLAYCQEAEGKAKNINEDNDDDKNSMKGFFVMLIIILSIGFLVGLCAICWAVYSRRTVVDAPRQGIMLQPGAPQPVPKPDFVKGRPVAPEQPNPPQQDV